MTALIVQELSRSANYSAHHQNVAIRREPGCGCCQSRWHVFLASVGEEMPAERFINVWNTFLLRFREVINNCQQIETFNRIRNSRALRWCSILFSVRRQTNVPVMYARCCQLGFIRAGFRQDQRSGAGTTQIGRLLSVLLHLSRNRRWYRLYQLAEHTTGRRPIC